MRLVQPVSNDAEFQLQVNAVTSDYRDFVPIRQV